MRVYELARDLGVDSKLVLEHAHELGLDVKTASSGLDEESAELLRLAFAGEEAAEEAAPAAEATEVVEEVLVEEALEEELEEEEPAETEVGLASLKSGATVSQFAEAIGVPTSDIVKTLLLRGLPIGAGQQMPVELMDEIAESYGFVIDVEAPPPPPVVGERPEHADVDADLQTRPAVVTVMGHVDHGKTTLLDRIRKTSVVEDEQGGITQHIGAYQVEVNGRSVTFIDTPGHEAFTALRARGANITDIVVLVVAANDGVMPQTVEAISHARAAGVKTIVAVNKIDVPGADPTRVRTELTEHEIITEELGGDVPSVEVSALSGEGVDTLLEVIDLIAQLEDYKANPNAPASGVVVEAQFEKGKGAVATVIVQRGTLETGDSFVAGAVAGRVRGLMDENGKPIKSALPSDPVQIMGWDDVPSAGDYFEVVESDREARRLAAGARRGVEERKPSGALGPGPVAEPSRPTPHRRGHSQPDREGRRPRVARGTSGVDREDRARGRQDPDRPRSGRRDQRERRDPGRGDRIGRGRIQRAPRAQGSQGRRRGGDRDPDLRDHLRAPRRDRAAPGGPAGAGGARASPGNRRGSSHLQGPRAGTIAGSYVVEGTIQRGARARLLRDGVIIHDGTISSLKRFKDDVREVASGFECGIGFENYNDIKEGDSIEAYLIREVART